MIEAYEIGIKLALQEDVTAGLAMIERELAEVDRAIAATSVSLGQLAHNAGSAVSAAAVSEAGRLKPAEAGSAGDVNSQPPSGQVSPKPEPLAPLASSPSSSIGARHSDPDLDSRNFGAGSQLPVIVNQAQPVAVENISAPIAKLPEEKRLLQDPARSISSSADAPPGAAPVGWASPVPAFNLSVTRPGFSEQRIPVQHIASVVGTPSVSTPPPLQQRPGTIFSSLGQTFPTRDASSALQSHGTTLSVESRVSPNSPGEPTIAPWLGHVPRSSLLPPHAAKMSERATAPQPQPREQNASGGGAVMLDGRLVGYWLSEQMAKDAARPPSSTTYFDSRQTPAWTASGAI